jgi:hypothetical protein
MTTLDKVREQAHRLMAACEALNSSSADRPPARARKRAEAAAPSIIHELAATKGARH